MTDTEKRTVNLPGKYAAFIDRMVAKGAYASADEVVCAGLSALRERDDAIECWLHEEVAPVYDKLMENPERTRPAQVVFDGIRERHRKVYELYVKQKIEAGLADIEAGRVIGHERVKAELLRDRD